MLLTWSQMNVFGALPALSDGITTLKIVTPTVSICEGEAFRHDLTMKMKLSLTG